MPNYDELPQDEYQNGKAQVTASTLTTTEAQPPAIAESSAGQRTPNRDTPHTAEEDTYMEVMRKNPERIWALLPIVDECEEYTRVRHNINEIIASEPIVHFKDYQTLRDVEARLYKEAMGKVKKVSPNGKHEGKWDSNEIAAMCYAVGRYQRQIAWFIGCRNAAKGIAAFLQQETVSTIWEIGSGRGALGLFTTALETNVTWLFTDSDVRGPPYTLPGVKTQHYDPTGEAGGTQQQILPMGVVPEVMVISWPPLQSSMAAAAVTMHKGKWLIYLGEGRDGCNADERFFDELATNWKPKEQVNCGPRPYDPRPWATDRCWILERRAPKRRGATPDEADQSQKKRRSKSLPST